jgi:hypothetical protein
VVKHHQHDNITGEQWLASLMLPLNLHGFSVVLLSFCKLTGGETTSTSQAQEQEGSHCLWNIEKCYLSLLWEGSYHLSTSSYQSHILLTTVASFVLLSNKSYSASATMSHKERIANMCFTTTVVEQSWIN